MEKQSSHLESEMVYYPRSNSTTLFNINLNHNTLSRPPTGTDLTATTGTDVAEDQMPTTASSLSPSRSPSQGLLLDDPLETAFRAPRPSVYSGGGGSGVPFVVGKDYGSPIGKLEPTSSVTPLMPEKQKKPLPPFRMENISLLSESADHEQEFVSPFCGPGGGGGMGMVASYHRVVARCLSCDGSRVMDVHRTVYVHESGACTPCPPSHSHVESAAGAGRASSSPTQAQSPRVHRAVYSANDADFFIPSFSRELSHSHINEMSPTCSVSRTDFEEGKLHRFQDASQLWKLDHDGGALHAKGISSGHRWPVSQSASRRVRRSHLRSHLHLIDRSHANSVAKVTPELTLRGSLSLSAPYLGNLAPVGAAFTPEATRRTTGSLESPSLLLSQSLPSEATMIDKGPDWAGGTPGSESLKGSNFFSPRDSSVIGDELDRPGSSGRSPQSQRASDQSLTRHRVGTGVEKLCALRPANVSRTGSSSLNDDASYPLSLGGGPAEDEFDKTQRPKEQANMMTSPTPPPPTRSTNTVHPLATTGRMASPTRTGATGKEHKVQDELRQYADAVQYAKSHKVGLTLKEILAKGKGDLEEEEEEEEDNDEEEDERSDADENGDNTDALRGKSRKQ